jgi:adenosine deaminase
MTTPLKRLIEALPKTELHVHLEGTLEPEMSFALARKNGIALPFESPEEILKAYDFTDLPSFLAIYYPAMNVLQDESDFFALTWAYLARARSQNIVYAELFFDPQAHTGRGVPFATVITGIRKAQEKASAELGIDSQLILCFLRDLPSDSAKATLLEALPYKHWLVGVGLDSDEKGNPPSKFAEVFALARAEGLKLTMHCDVNQQNTLGHIGQVLHDIGVDRIDHGINSLEDPALCNVIAERGLGLTVCPISNRFVVQDLTATHLRRMLQLGMRATVNSDDPAYFRAYVNENYFALAEDGGMTQDEIVQLVRNGFLVSWIDEARRQRYLAQVDATLARLAA